MGSRSFAAPCRSAFTSSPLSCILKESASMGTKNLLAHRCHMKVYRAIRRTLEGKEHEHPLEPPYYLPCRDCGSTVGGSEYHHTTYRTWWRVMPLCRVCHRARHRKNSRRHRKDRKR